MDSTFSPIVPDTSNLHLLMLQPWEDNFCFRNIPRTTHQLRDMHDYIDLYKTSNLMNHEMSEHDNRDDNAMSSQKR